MIQNRNISGKTSPALRRARGSIFYFRVLLLSSSIFLSLLLAAILVLPVAAQDSSGQVTDDDVNAIAKELYCPICESTPLDVCATQACADWRQVIRTKLAEGQSEEEIKAYFLDQYGPRALAEPPRSGITLTVWLLPVLALIIGGIVLWRYFRNSRKMDTGDLVTETPNELPPPADIEPEADDYRSRIESELREMKR